MAGAVVFMAVGRLGGGNGRGRLGPGGVGARRTGAAVRAQVARDPVKSCAVTAPGPTPRRCEPGLRAGPVSREKPMTGHVPRQPVAPGRVCSGGGADPATADAVSPSSQVTELLGER